jgi:N-sulfoglucosamine sulfohydrolase
MNTSYFNLCFMKKIRIFYIVVIFSTLMSCSAGSDQKEKLNEKPNIIFILGEDMSHDLSCFGMQGVKTPVLDQLAKEGVMYTNTFGANPICSPNRSNMMTGVHQNIINAQHHRSNRNIALKEPYKPITKLLRDAGYTTILGHDGVHGKGKKIDVNFTHNPVGEWNGVDQFGLFDKIGEFKKEDQPFFAQITLTVSHRGDWWNRIRNKSKHKVSVDSIILPPYIADTPETRLDWAKYLDQVEYLDYEVGMIMKELDEKGLRENTVVIYVGDNGRSNIRGKGYLYDAGLRVPLIIYGPKFIDQNKVDDRIASSMDISATILDIANVDLPDYMEAISLMGDKKRDYVYSARDLWDEVLEQSRAISTKRFRYIKNNITELPYDAHQAYLEFYRPAVHVMRSLNEKGELNEFQSKFFDTKPAEEFYDLKNDPFEEFNLINDPNYKSEIDRLKSYYENWNKNHHDYGFDPIIWENCPPPKSVEVLKWLEESQPEVIESMKKGIEPGFNKYVKAHRKLTDKKK